MDKDIRWKQRFQNFEKAFMRFQEALEKEGLTELERNGLIQRFEFTVELCWNTLKDYMESEAIKFEPTPKATIRQAQVSGFITNAQDLIDALDLRNKLSHNYDESEFKKAEFKIRKYIFTAIESVYLFFKARMEI